MSRKSDPVDGILELIKWIILAVATFFIIRAFLQAI